jgi:aminoglycoside 3-N-acetyltransferase
MGWARADVSEALEKLQVPKDATVFVHANAGFLGKPKQGLLANELALGFLDDSSRTVVLPAFSYSFGRNEVFDPRRPPSSMGVLSDLAGDQGWARSLDPMFSVWARGPRSGEIVRIKVGSSFGEGSVFGRLVDRDDTYLVTINLGAGSTLIHEIEHGLGVPYRFEKVFHGQVQLENVSREISWTSYVRDLHDPETKHDFRRLTEDLEQDSLRRITSLGNGLMASIGIRTFKRYIEERVEKDASYLIKRGFGQ